MKIRSACAFMSAMFVAGASCAAPPAGPAAAVFPFKTGIYSSKPRCAANRENTFEFTARYSHEYEADQNVDFKKVVKVAEGRYLITESVEDDEGKKYVSVSEYQQLTPNSFKVTSGKGTRKQSVTTYTFCPGMR